MAAEDITDQVTAWALDEVSRQCMGEHYGVSVTWAPVPAQSPSGVQVVPVWHLLITGRNPLLAEGPLYHTQVIGDMALIDAHVRPKQDTVRAAVTAGLRAICGLASRKLAGPDGKPSVPAGHR